jgi:hypothetical protein
LILIIRRIFTNIDYYYNPKDGSVVNFDSTKMPNNNILWSPRAGFNWDITGDKTKQLVEEQYFTGRLPVWIEIK